VNESKQHVTVTIAGEQYSLRSDRSLEYTRAVADHVDRAIHEARENGPKIETHKAAILAALAITDELFRSRLEAREIERRLAGLADRLSRFVPPRKRPSRASGAFASSPEPG